MCSKRAIAISHGAHDRAVAAKINRVSGMRVDRDSIVCNDDSAV